MPISIPKRILALPEEERERERVRFLIRSAAMKYSPVGGMKKLSIAIGLHPNTLQQAYTITGPIAISLEQVLDDPDFTRQIFAPTIFPDS